MYSSSKGTVKLADMRSSALCDRDAKGNHFIPIVYWGFFSSIMHLSITHSPDWFDFFLLSPFSFCYLVFEEVEDPSSKSFFSEIISSISDIKFSRDGRFILSRDYMTLKIWDIAMESKPVKTIHIHDHLRAKLCDLYENDCIFDKFECTVSYDGKYPYPANICSIMLLRLVFAVISSLTI